MNKLQFRHGTISYSNAWDLDPRLLDLRARVGGEIGQDCGAPPRAVGRLFVLPFHAWGRQLGGWWNRISFWYVNDCIHLYTLYVYVIYQYIYIYIIYCIYTLCFEYEYVHTYTHIYIMYIYIYIHIGGIVRQIQTWTAKKNLHRWGIRDYPADSQSAFKAFQIPNLIDFDCIH